MSNENFRIRQVSHVGSPKRSWNKISPAQAQRESADKLGIKVTAEDTFAVVASHILERMGNEIGSPPGSLSEDYYLAFGAGEIRRRHPLLWGADGDRPKILCGSLR